MKAAAPTGGAIRGRSLSALYPKRGEARVIGRMAPHGNPIFSGAVVAPEGAEPYIAVARQERGHQGLGKDPMSSFDDRQDQFEKKFAHDAGLRFKAEARRNKLLGQWAAGLLGLSGEKAEAYAKSIVAADLQEKGDEDVFRKLRADFDAAGVAQSDHQIRRHMEDFLAKAIEEIQAKG